MSPARMRRANARRKIQRGGPWWDAPAGEVVAVARALGLRLELVR